MLIIFSCDEYPNITMLGDDGKRLLKIMGRNSSAGTIRVNEIPDAITRLKDNIITDDTNQGGTATKDNDNDDANQAPISLAKRAYPLIEMLTTAAENNCEVTWKSS